MEIYAYLGDFECAVDALDDTQKDIMYDLKVKSLLCKYEYIMNTIADVLVRLEVSKVKMREKGIQI